MKKWNFMIYKVQMSNANLKLVVCVGLITTVIAVAEVQRDVN